MRFRSPAFVGAMTPAGGPAYDTPADIFGANLIAWFRSSTGFFTDTAGTASASPADPVAHWSDQAGGDDELTQSTSANMPALDATGRFLAFDGVNDFLTNAAMPRGGVDRVYAFRANLKNTGALQILFGHITGGAGEVQLRITSGGNFQFFIFDQTPTLFSPSISGTGRLGSWKTYILRVASTGFEFFVDGSSIYSQSFTTAISTSAAAQFRLGSVSGFPADAEFAEFVIASGTFTSGMRADLEAWLDERETA